MTDGVSVHAGPRRPGPDGFLSPQLLHGLPQERRVHLVQLEAIEPRRGGPSPLRACERNPRPISKYQCAPIHLVGELSHSAEPLSPRGRVALFHLDALGIAFLPVSRYEGMAQDRLDGQDLERALLRIRLVGLALGATLLVLTPGSDRLAAGAALLGYAAALLVQRFAPVARAGTGLRTLGVAVDVLYAAGLALLLPPTAGAWALYAFAIGTAALSFGPLGAAIASGGSIFAYDLGLAVRSDALHPGDLWPVQLLLALGVVAAELAWSAGRGDVIRKRMRTFTLAQRDLIAAHDENELFARLADHAVRSFDARVAWIEGPDGVAHARGDVSAEATNSDALTWTLADAPAIQFRCVFADARTAAQSGSAISDLVTDAAPLILAARERVALAHAEATLVHVLTGVRAIERDRAVNAVLAQVVITANEIAGNAALVRPADGVVVAGDVSTRDAVAVAREVVPPALVPRTTSAPTTAVISAGPGLALVATGTQHDLTDDDLRSLGLLGEIAAAAAERIGERDSLVARASDLERHITELDGRLRARDDAVASAVHELRTPLSSVHAYAQLTSRNLQSVQQQVKQLDRLIADLLRLPGDSLLELELADVDVLQEARQGSRRAALVTGRTVTVDAVGGGPFVVRADRSRIEQVIDNLVGNAMKFSPPTQNVDIELRRNGDEVVASVSDRGAGILPEDLGHVFERYYRAAGQRDLVPGAGLGLAIAREIVEAHGGRIWAESDGPGRGSRFFIALPAGAAVSDPTRLKEETVR